MLQTFFKTLAVASLSAMSATAQVTELCAMPTWSLTQAVNQYPDEAFALREVLKQPMGSWYTDYSKTDTPQLPRKIVQSCNQDQRVFAIVYGLPNKDCQDGYANTGYNKNSDDYRKFIQDMVDAVGNRKALYVLEPDAVGLVANGGCAVTGHYIEYVQMALGMLSKNPNAEIYLDVGFWTLMDDASALKIANVVKELQKGGRIKGIALNTSNYRPNKEIAGYCDNFQKAYGDTSLHCIVDTSRNYNEHRTSDEWCNARYGGIGHPPTSNTGYANIDYFVWIKIPGESDGTCDGAGRSKDSMVGPAAGSFFQAQFVKLWNQGYFVAEKGMAKLYDPDQQNTTTSPVPVTNPETNPVTTTPTPSSSGGAAKWAQCGGNGFSGPTTCAEGKCVKLNDWYSQCQ